MRVLGGAGFETRAVGAGASKAELSEANALVVVSEAAGGKGGVAPDALPVLMEKVPDSVTRLLYVSTHGVERTGQMPFSMQNVFGQLDKLRAAEQEVQLRALNKVPSYSIVRVGKIGGGGERCEVLPGDGLQGDVSAAAAGAVVRESLLRAEAVNASLSVGPLAAGGGAATDAEHWDDMFLKLVGPEIFRKPLKALGAAAAASWIQEWAQGFFKEGQKLTTPIQVENVEDGVCIRFLEKGGTGYADFDEPETVDDRYAASRAASSAGRAKARARADGALLVVAEAAPSPRVRVARAEMREGTVVKEMSEQTVLGALEKDLRRGARGAEIGRILFTPRRSQQTHVRWPDAALRTRCLSSSFERHRKKKLRHDGKLQLRRRRRAPRRRGAHNSHAHAAVRLRHRDGAKCSEATR